MIFLGIFLLVLITVNAENNFNSTSPFLNRGAHFKSTRITGGNIAKQGQFSWQAGLQIDLGEDSSFCGGTLISKQHVLTAAHCCEGANEIKVILGSVKIHNTTDPHRVTMIVQKKDIKIHESYNSEKIVHDICMLKLPQEVELSAYIKIASLPKDNSKLFYGELAVASGWGRDSDNAQSISSELKFVKMKILRNAVCSIYFFEIVKDTNICTSGAGGKSTCSGDSGGPLILDGGNTLVGITSFGISFGCEVGWPAVFTRVTKYLPWIRSNIN